MKTAVNPPSAPPKRRSKRLLLLSALGLGLVSAAAVYLFCSFHLSVGSGPAGPVVVQEAFAQAWTQRPVMLVGLGDSVTAGFGARRGYGYFERLVSIPSEEATEMKGLSLATVFPHLRSTNLAVSGSTSFEVALSQLPHLPVANRETLGWVVVTTGGNDLIHNYGRTPAREQAMYGASWQEAQPWISNFETRLETLVTEWGTRFPGGCHIFLANIFDPTDGQGDIQRAGLPAWPDGARILAAYNEVFSRCASKHANVHVVDLHQAFLGHGIHCGQFWSPHYRAKDPHYWYYTNLEDPNERGYDAIRRLCLNEMAKVARQLNGPQER